MTRTEYERTMNAMLFFAEHTRKCVAKKLFKLLYLLDVRQFQRDGRTVTGLQYAAYTPGPVPPSLAHHLEHVSGNVARFVRTAPIVDGGKQRQEVFPAEGAVFDDQAFTPRQLNAMRDIAIRYADDELQDIDVSAHDEGAWQRALARGREEDVRLEETLVTTDALREAKLAIAEQHRRSTRTHRVSL